MPDRYRLPFSQVNSAPFVDGIEDVVIEIPTLQEIVDAVGDATVDQTDIDETIVSAIEDQIQVGDDLIADVVDQVETSLGIDVPGQGSVIDQIVEAISAELADGQLDVPEIDDIDELVRDAITEELDLDDVGQIGVNFEGVFGPLSSDIADALEDVINFDPQDILDEIPGLDEFVDEVETALDGLSPDIDGVEFWSDPIDFAALLVDRAVDQAVDDETADRLNQAVSNADL